MVMSGDCFFVVTPMRCTSGGSTGIAMATRFCTSTCAVSRLVPSSVMTMLITPAKIGRSMKKCGKFMARRPVDGPLSLRLVRLRDAGRRACSRRLRNRLNSHTGLQQLQTRRDNFLAILQTVLHDPFSFENTSGFKITAFDCVIRFHDERVFQSLL